MSLFVVPTPIGNLKDITYRAVEVLKNSDIILAEDTRTSHKILKHYSINVKLESFHMHNEHKKIQKVLRQLKGGTTISIISDAGTPGISDPGFLLVRESLANQIEVFCLPGPTALIPALIQSGFPTDRFVFEGFLPQKKGRLSRIKSLAIEKRTIVIYESPHRIIKTLTQLLPHFGETRKVSVVRELTKKFETQFRGSINEAINYFSENKPKGEFVISISAELQN
ncbi:MAG: 16S rRNA (cytidine(1402)-2'-O)-methyltransferase [Flavobacteriales bacterium]|jgi:16S rRNA (cytidine1402-2'-O)-methyltransferase|nr:16S rRNA (cytidine(1402)-2'-O)-methyltransferase [Flavobacteriales bacterium]|tara:strand:+ start:1653 stop:2327 length:675 start_codon:yes stop_codon:yes gene_type:complete